MSRQKGSALLLALIIMALITTITVASSDYLQRALVRNQTLQWQTEARWMLLGNEAIILSHLDGSLPLSHAIYRPGMMGDMIIEYRLRDLNSCFNLNALHRVAHPAENKPTDVNAGVTVKHKKNPDLPPERSGENTDLPQAQIKESHAVAVFTQLVKHVTGLDNEAAKRITDNVVEWANPRFTARTDEQAGGKKRPPPIMDISELRVIPGLDLAHYRRLKPWICVLPETALKINVNALNEDSASLLSALTLGEISSDKAKSFIQSRPAQGWNKPEAIIAWLKENNYSSAENIKPMLALTSHYFLLSQWAMRDNQRYALHSLIKYEEKMMHVEQRKYGISEIN